MATFRNFGLVALSMKRFQMSDEFCFGQARMSVCPGERRATDQQDEKEGEGPAEKVHANVFPPQS